MSKTKQLKDDPRIDSIDDERGYGNGYFVYLKAGYRYGDAHCFSEDTKADVRRTLRQLQPCTCEDCQRAVKTTGSVWR